MADTEFEQFRQCFESLPQHYKNTALTYTLVHDVALDDGTDGSSGSPPSPRSDTEEEGGGGKGCNRRLTDRSLTKLPSEIIRINSDKLPPRALFPWATPVDSSASPAPPQSNPSLSSTSAGPPRERRRRRLPEIPKNATTLPGCYGTSSTAANSGGHMSLLAELNAAGAGDVPMFAPGGATRPLLLLKCGELQGQGSPDSPNSAADTADSGHSTLHSPKSMSPQLHGERRYFPPASPTTSSLEGSRLRFSSLEVQEATHRGLYKFVPRHHDEMEVEIGDPIYVQKEADDLWCEGVNLRSGQTGSFPSAYAVDLEYTELDPSEPRIRRERFLLRYLGSVETHRHKGTPVLEAAVSKMVKSDGTPKMPSTPCILEVSDNGLRMSDSGRRKAQTPSTTSLDYFYSLKHVSFCAYHPRDQKYLGFITKHPQMQRFACHVFLGRESTRPVAESIGRAFQRFYQKYLETAYPIEDIYIE